MRILWTAKERNVGKETLTPCSPSNRLDAILNSWTSTLKRAKLCFLKMRYPQAAAVAEILTVRGLWSYRTAVYPPPNRIAERVWCTG